MKISLLFIALVLMLAGMLTLAGAAFVRHKKRLLSIPYLLIMLFSVVLAGVLYPLTGSGPELAHYELEKTIQKMGGLEAIIRQIEKRVAEHPEDSEGQAILDKLRKKPSRAPHTPDKMSP